MIPNSNSTIGKAAFIERDKKSWSSLQRLWQQLFPASVNESWLECWRWLYEQNPFWSSAESYPLVGYWSEGQLVGQLGLIPTQVRLDGKWMPAAWCIDYHILPSHQRQGIGRKLLDCALARIPLLLTLGQTDASYGLFLKAGWHGKDQSLIRSRKILRPLPVLLKRFVGRTAAEASGDARKIPAKAGPFGSLPIETLTSWAGELKAFAEHNDIAGDGHGFVARTVEFMEWRYMRHPRLRYTLLKVVSSQTAQTVAYAVVRFGRRGRYDKASLCDLIPVPFGRPETQEVRAATVTAVTEFCKLCGAEFLDIHMSPHQETGGAVQRAMYRDRPGHRFLYGMAQMSECADLPVSSWALSPGDCDVDLLEAMEEIGL